MSARRRIAVVTGASGGIGAATARALRAEGFELVIGARRVELLRAVAEPLGARALPLDLADPDSVEAFVAALGPAHQPIDLLVNNAGVAFGMDAVADARDDRWQAIFEVNVLGVVRMTRALLPRIEVSGDGQIIIVGSTSGFEVYPGGAAYTASKHAVRAIAHTLRLELLGRPVRVSQISPGLVETDFALVRHGGDRERAAATYRGYQPLAPEDVAECIRFAATRPAHVNIDEIIVRPRDQATATRVHRREREE